ncbi:SprT-like domain-containing protein Spartan [Armadillidium vulgare]|nr:SprT-like domain-containing protein Spartan [Armadillidium vulgare]
MIEVKCRQKKMNYNIEEIDLSLAIQLQAQFEEELRVQRIKDEEKQKSLEIVGHKWNAKWMSLPEPDQEKLSVSLIDPCWEYLDPNPNIYDLFLTFNHQFFWGRLMGVEVKWSPRMTLCAGVCSYEGRGGLCSHEMIHAYLFVTHNNTDHDGHGPQFHTHMYRINKLAGTHISVYHSFHDEVNVYRQHIWQCDGPCRKRPPYFGLVKRSMNRPPAPRDLWWERHAQSCGGKYTKIQEPEGYGQPKSKRKVKDESLQRY